MSKPNFDPMVHLVNGAHEEDSRLSTTTTMAISDLPPPVRVVYPHAKSLVGDPAVVMVDAKFTELVVSRLMTGEEEEDGDEDGEEAGAGAGAAASNGRSGGKGSTRTRTDGPSGAATATSAAAMMEVAETVVDGTGNSQSRQRRRQRQRQGQRQQQQPPQQQQQPQPGPKPGTSTMHHFETLGRCHLLNTRTTETETVPVSDSDSDGSVGLGGGGSGSRTSSGARNTNDSDDVSRQLCQRGFRWYDDTPEDPTTLTTAKTTTRTTSRTTAAASNRTTTRLNFIRRKFVGYNRPLGRVYYSEFVHDGEIIEVGDFVERRTLTGEGEVIDYVRVLGAYQATRSFLGDWNTEEGEGGEGRSRRRRRRKKQKKEKGRSLADKVQIQKRGHPYLIVAPLRLRTEVEIEYGSSSSSKFRKKKKGRAAAAAAEAVGVGADDTDADDTDVGFTSCSENEENEEEGVGDDAGRKATRKKGGASKGRGAGAGSSTTTTVAVEEGEGPRRQQLVLSAASSDCPSHICMLPDWLGCPGVSMTRIDVEVVGMEEEEVEEEEERGGSNHFQSGATAGGRGRRKRTTRVGKSAGSGREARPSSSGGGGSASSRSKPVRGTYLCRQAMRDPSSVRRLPRGSGGSRKKVQEERSESSPFSAHLTLLQYSLLTCPPTELVRCYIPPTWHRRFDAVQVQFIREDRDPVWLERFEEAWRGEQGGEGDDQTVVRLHYTIESSDDSDEFDDGASAGAGAGSARGGAAGESPQTSQRSDGGWKGSSAENACSGSEQPAGQGERVEGPGREGSGDEAPDDTTAAAAAVKGKRRAGLPPSHSTSGKRAARRKRSSSPSPNENEEDIAEPPRHINGYYEVDKILDRRVRKLSRKHPDRQIVEYQVSWKGLTEPPSWQIAENLDQNSLAAAFHLFPKACDPERSASMVEDDQNILFAATDDDGDESSDEEDGADVFVDTDATEMSMDEDVECDSVLNECDPEKESGKDVDPALQHLTTSNFDAPGTVEFELNRRTYRVGQSYYESGVSHRSIVLTISMINPQKHQAECEQWIRIEDTFAAPSGMEGRYVQTKSRRIVDLSKLKDPVKQFKVLPFKYELGRNACNFAYYYEGGKVANHFPKSSPHALDLFAGAGGMSVGLERAGFEVKWAVEHNAHAAATYLANNAQRGIKVYSEDVNVFLKKSRRCHPAYPSVGEVDHIHASPPCQGFSRANRNGGSNDDHNNHLVFAFVKAVKHFKPMTATFENVPGLLMPALKRYIQDVVASLVVMKYQVRCSVLTSSAYGDPQSRKRVILWASRSDVVLPASPAPTHGPGLLSIATTKSAIQMLEGHCASHKGSGIVSIKGAVVHSHLCSSVQPTQDDHVLLADEPSRTVLAKSRQHVHYNGMRFLTVRECACLQSFPAAHQFFGSMQEQFKQVGNAVPVKMATAVARSVGAVHGLP